MLRLCPGAQGYTICSRRSVWCSVPGSLDSCVSLLRKSGEASPLWGVNQSEFGIHAFVPDLGKELEVLLSLKVAEAVKS